MYSDHPVTEGRIQVCVPRLGRLAVPRRVRQTPAGSKEKAAVASRHEDVRTVKRCGNRCPGCHSATTWLCRQITLQFLASLLCCVVSDRPAGGTRRTAVGARGEVRRRGGNWLSDRPVDSDNKELSVWTRTQVDTASGYGTL